MTAHGPDFDRQAYCAPADQFHAMIDQMVEEFMQDESLGMTESELRASLLTGILMIAVPAGHA